MTPLDALLDRVAEALLTGDLARIGQLAPEIEALAERLRPADGTEARRLQAKARRNARLLEAAARGVRAARQRVTEIRRGPTLTTYDASGRKAAILPVGTEAVRRV